MRKFLASVGNAKLLGKVNGKFTPIADVKTLTESTLSFSNSMEEVVAGQGAQLYGRVANSSRITCSLTDAMFDINYIALQVGAELNANGIEASGLVQEKVTSDSTGKITLKNMPTKLGTACGLDKIVVWYKKSGCDAEATYDSKILDAASQQIDGLKASTDYCVEYFVNKPGNNALQVSSSFIPAELVLVLTTQLFAGDASAPETGKPIGSITVKIPRFQLDGTFDLSMAMTSAATMSLQGMALAVDDGSCEGKGVYAEIVEILNTNVLENTLKDIVIDPDTVAADKVPDVYGLFKNGSVSKLDNFKIYGDSFADTKEALGTGSNTIVVYEGTLPKSGTITTKAITKAGDVVYYAETVNV